MLQTTVQIKGTVNGKPQSCTFVQDAGPAEIFRNRTPEEMFRQGTASPKEADVCNVELEINVQRPLAPGFVSGFVTNDLQQAIREAFELDKATEGELLLEFLPDKPEELIAMMVQALLEKDRDKAYALAALLEIIARQFLGKDGEGAGAQLVDLAGEIMQQIREKMA